MKTVLALALVLFNSANVFASENCNLAIVELIEATSEQLKAELKFHEMVTEENKDDTLSVRLENDFLIKKATATAAKRDVFVKCQ